MMSRRYLALAALSLGLSVWYVGWAAGAPQESKPETPPAAAEKAEGGKVEGENPGGAKQPSGGGLFSALFESKLERAIKRGLRPGGSLATELGKLKADEISSRSDAETICGTLSALLQREEEGVPVPAADFEGLALLLTRLSDEESTGLELLAQRGLPILEKLYDRQLERLDSAEIEHLLSGLQALALFGTEGSEERILTAIQRKIGTDGYGWEPIFDLVFTTPLPSDEFFARLKQNLPAGQAGLALLSAANAAAVDGELKSHPFDSATGLKRLRVWLSDRYDSSPAYSATVALAFVSEEIRSQLLPLALRYPDPYVQLEAGWAAGRQGDEQGLRMLAGYCRDLEYSERAQRYLEELGRGELIPDEAKAPDFRARALFSDWLQHPNELGEAPDEVEVVDSRELKWPLEEKPGTFWLVRYLKRDSSGLEPDDVGCGLVGSVTWCFFDPQMLRRPPEDVYAIHCAWEMEQQELIRLQEPGAAVLSNELLKLLVKPLEQAKLLVSARVATKLKLPARRYFLAEGKVDGVAGWMVFAETEVAWYSQADQPESTSGETILRIHLGRSLLGFKDDPNRRQALSRQLPARTPEEIITAYERLLEELFDSGSEEQAELFSSFNPLVQNFDKYLEALAAARGGKKEQYLLEKYAEILDWTEDADGPARERIFSTNGLLGEHFDAYAAALVASGDGGKVPELIERFALHWQFPFGYNRFGKAAYRAGRLDLAEQWLAKIATDYEYRHQDPEMSLLAEIWQGRGEVDKARDLLLDCLHKLTDDSRAAKYEEAKRRAAELYRQHRATFLRLFPEGAAALEAKRLPEKLPFDSASSDSDQ
ncbi:MAG: tetratricopeptide repeat protein [Planctomycetota bacterium]